MPPLRTPSQCSTRGTQMQRKNLSCPPKVMQLGPQPSGGVSTGSANVRAPLPAQLWFSFLLAWWQLLQLVRALGANSTPVGPGLLRSWGLWPLLHCWRRVCPGSGEDGFWRAATWWWGYFGFTGEGGSPKIQILKWQVLHLLLLPSLPL